MNENEQKSEQETLEAPKPEPTLEDNFPIENFKDMIIVLFKHVIQGGPVSLRIIGNSWLAGEIMKGGRHEVSGTSGHTIVFNGNDVLWAECVTAREDRDRAIAQARAQLAAEQAKALEEKLAHQERAEAEAKARDAREAAKKGRGLLGWLRGEPRLVVPR